MHNHSNEHQDSLRNRDKQQLGNGPLSESPHTTDVEVGEKSEETNFLTLIKVTGLLNNLHFSLDIERLSYDLAKINVKTERKQKCKTLNCLIEQKQTSANFHCSCERGCKQRHLSMELSGKFRLDVS